MVVPVSQAKLKTPALRYQYDASTKTCLSFSTYNGCGGTFNNFESQNQCPRLFSAPPLQVLEAAKGCAPCLYSIAVDVLCIITPFNPFATSVLDYTVVICALTFLRASLAGAGSDRSQQKPLGAAFLFLETQNSMGKLCM